MKLLLQHRIFIGYIILIAVIFPMTAILIYKHVQLSILEKKIVEILQIQRDILEKAVCYERDSPTYSRLVEDTDGNIYFFAYEQMALVRHSPNRIFKALVNDGLFYTQAGYLYIILEQWNHLPEFNNGEDLRKSPILVGRTKIEKDGNYINCGR